MIQAPDAALHSSSLERDARLIHDDHEASAGDIALGVVIGRTSEFFDFFVYAIGSALVFPALFFPEFSPLQGTLCAFAIFALAFMARPVGSFVFMAVDRRYGRGTKLTVALFLLGGSTASIAFLPGFEKIGWWAVALLALFRLGQGFALGGAWDGLASLLSLNAPKNKRGWYAMVPQLGAPLGFLLASGLFAYIYSTLSTQDFLDWGWRYPFFVAFAVNVVALFARLRLVATREFSNLLDKHELEPTTVFSLLDNEGHNVLIGAFVPLASFALFHLVTVFPLAWIALTTDRSPADFMVVQMIGAGLCLVSVVVSGLLADRIGRRSQLATGAVLIGLFALASPFLLNGGRHGETIFVLVGFTLLGLSFGQASGALASNFSRRFRYTGAAITSDIAWLLGAAFAPLVALSLSDLIGPAAVGAYLLSGVACTLGALRLNRRQLEIQDR
ncbi:MFS transporter [Roseomonas sp. 18066]|uniref:MFS transporter n=1 Tax=Roseomonas sp. 18066 TaxID=2681412 RepID=UPI0013584279|nr:MFS transporter [Roseomonas sp. 18066]